MSRRARRESAAPVGFDPERYESWFETELGQLVWEDERAALLPLLGPMEGRAILDAGVGEARLALELAQRGGPGAGGP